MALWEMEREEGRCEAREARIGQISSEARGVLMGKKKLHAGIWGDHIVQVI